jgi:hypothetical protein
MQTSLNKNFDQLLILKEEGKEGERELRRARNIGWSEER